MCQITVNPQRPEEEDIDSGPLPSEPDPTVREQNEKEKRPIRMSLFSPDLVTSMMMISPSRLRRRKQQAGIFGGMGTESGGSHGGGGTRGAGQGA